jgi:hypothetical protein
MALRPPCCLGLVIRAGPSCCPEWRSLTSPETVANLLGDFLPDAPREAGLLVAGVRAGIPGVLADLDAQGAGGLPAIRLAAASLAERTAFALDACEWAAAELAIAAGFASDDIVAADGRPGPALAVRIAGSVPPAPAAEGSETVGVSLVAPGAMLRVAGRRDWKRLTLTWGAAVLAVVAVAGLAVAYAYSRQPTGPAGAASARHHVIPPAAGHRTTAVSAAPAQCTPGPVSRTLVAANPQLSSLSWHLVSYACQGGWAAVAMYAASAGNGEAFLLRAGSRWDSGQLDGGDFACSDLSHAFLAPVPPQPVAIRLFQRVGLCRAR